MANKYRCVYIPMPVVSTQQQLVALMRNPDGFGVMQGIEEGDAWALYRVKQEEIETAGRRLLRRFEQKQGKGHDRMLRHGVPRALSVLERRERERKPPVVLYVHSHGNSQFVGFRPLTLTPSQLAKRLELDGLPRQAMEIKLWSCHSGEPFAEDNKVYLQEFTTALQGLRYYNVNVYGYIGSVTVTEPGQHKTAHPTSGVKRAKESRVQAATGPDPEASEETGEDGLRPPPPRRKAGDTQGGSPAKKPLLKRGV